MRRDRESGGMTKIKASNFGVRFYRRGMPKVSVPSRNVVQDNAQKPVKVKVMPARDAAFQGASLKRLIARKKILVAFTRSAIEGYPFRIFDGTSCVAGRFQLNALRLVPLEGPVVAVQKPIGRMIGANEQMLWAAAYSGDCAMIRKLVMDGADLDARDGDGRTAINIATQYGRQDALKTLLAAKEMRYLASLGKLPDTAFFRKFQTQKTGT